MGGSAAALGATLSAIRLTAERTVVRADGQSTTVITATIYDSSGNPVPDGSRVRFSTTLGQLDSTVVVTQGGTAHVTLTSASQPGEALVVAALDTPGATVPQNITISFSRDADSANTGIAWARIDGPYVAFAWDYQIIQAIATKRGQARFSYRGLAVSAHNIQIDVTQNILVASGDVVLTESGVTRLYRSLNYKLEQGEGTGERLVDNRLQSVDIRGASLTETSPPAGAPRLDPETYQIVDLSKADLTIVAHSIALEPTQQIQFRNADFYFGSVKRLHFPYHIMGIGQNTIFPEQAFGINSDGLAVNYPYFFDAQPTGVGAVHLRHGAPIGGSAYAVRPGWNVDLSQTYNGPHSTEGSADIYGVTRSGWNAQFRHAQRLDPITTGSVFLNLSQLSSALLTSQLTRNYAHFQLNATGSADRANSIADPLTGVRGSATGDVHGQLNAQSYSRALFGVKQLLYSLNTNVSRQGFFGGNPGVQQGTIITQSMGSRFFTTPLPITGNTTLTQSADVAQTWVQGKVATLNGVPSSGISLQTQTSLNRQLSRLGSTSLTYGYTQTPQVLYSGITTQTFGIGHQKLGLTLNLAKNDLWSLTFNGAHGLDVDQTTAFATVGYRIAKNWRGNIVINDDTIQGTHYRDVEYRLTHHIALLQRDFSVFYDTTARHVQFDISAIGF